MGTIPNNNLRLYQLMEKRPLMIVIRLILLMIRIIFGGSYFVSNNLITLKYIFYHRICRNTHFFESACKITVSALRQNR